MRGRWSIEIATITEVTHGGRAKVGTRTFNLNGSEYGHHLGFREIVPLTDELRAEIASRADSRAAFQSLDYAIAALGRWIAGTGATGSHKMPTHDPANAAIARRIAAAIQKAMTEEGL